MLEVHLALIVAVIASIVAVRRHQRLRDTPGWNQISANEISADVLYAKRIVVQSRHDERKDVQLSIDRQGRTVIDFPDDIIEGERWNGISLRCGRGLGGFRLEFVFNPEDDASRQFIALAFSPPQTIIETQPELKWSPPHVQIFDGDNNIIAQVP